MTARSSSGWLLVGLIVLISVVILALAGITFALTEHLRSTSLRQNQTRAIYLAQAGVMRAIYEFRFDDSGIGGNDAGFRLNQDCRVDTSACGSPGSFPNDDVFMLGGIPRDFLLVNLKPISFPAASSLCSASRHRMTGWRLRNVLLDASPTVAIDRVAVKWAPDLGETVIRLDLNGAQRWPASGCSSMVSEPDPDPPYTNTMDLVPNVSLAAGGEFPSNTVWFSNTGFRASPTTTTKTFIDLIFMLTDGSVRVAHFENAIANRDANFTVKAVGKVRKGPFPFVLWRRLQADYRICAAVTGESQCDTTAEEQNTRTGALRSFQELNTESP